ncbi:MAG: hypothetical protein A4S09_11555 [Proteobacteria bacterium SG_bin7]|nr:MAG: hypothetical protein A4S09_11555 [Proteobacteria bacterium SG_bin7]
MLNGESTIYSLHENTKRVLASLSKIPTAGAVLRKIPVTTRFKTQILGGKVTDEGVLDGDLYLKGGADPGFVSETMWVLVNNLSRSGLKHVKGNIVVDDTLFDKNYISDSRQNVRVDRAYDAPVSAMSFNWNSVNICVRPGEGAGKDARVVLDPPNKYVQLVNNAKTSKDGSKLNISVERKPVEPFGDRLEVNGTIPVGYGEKIIYKNISSPTLWSGYNLQAFLDQRGIKVDGSVRDGKVGGNSEVLAEVESWPLSSIVSDMMKFSSNYVAEMLTKHLSGPSEDKVGNMKEGLDRIREFIADAGVSKSDFVFDSPSGFNRNNQMSAKDLAKVLESIRDDFRLYPEFLTSLPISGYDGTLKNRMTSPNVQGWVRAKTGMLNGVIGLAGFAGRKSGQVLTFVFIYNGSADMYKVRDFFDNLSETLVL